MEVDLAQQAGVATEDEKREMNSEIEGPLHLINSL